MKPIHYLLAFSIILVFAQPVFAYLDPSTGSFVLQMIIAGMLGAIFTIKIYWRKLKGFISRLFGKNVKKSSDETP